MKCFTVSAGRVSAGVPLTSGMIQVGEAGRNRHPVSVLVPDGSMVDGAMLLAVPGEYYPAGAVVVLIKDHSDYPSTWRLRTARTRKAWEVLLATEAAHNAVLKSLLDLWDKHAEAHSVVGSPHGSKLFRNCPACAGALARVMGKHSDSYTFADCSACAEHAEEGQFGAYAPTAPPVAVIAQGLAGCADGGPEYLIVLKPGQSVEIVQEWRPYGDPTVSLVTNQDGTVAVTDPRAAVRSAMARSQR